MPFRGLAVHAAAPAALLARGAHEADAVPLPGVPTGHGVLRAGRAGHALREVVQH